MPFPINANVRVERDDSGNVKHLEHFQQPFVAAPTSAEAAAALEAVCPQPPPRMRKPWRGNT
jgi:hypothetical protein